MAAMAVPSDPVESSVGGTPPVVAAQRPQGAMASVGINATDGIDGRQRQSKDPAQEAESSSHLRVGRMVNVAARTWPGINKQGGTGRVTALHMSVGIGEESTGAVTHVDVRYVVVGGREKRVPVCYIKAAPEYEDEVLPGEGGGSDPAAAPDGGGGRDRHAGTAGGGAVLTGGIPNRRRRPFHLLRDRSMLLGRCGRCGSLRSDCGSCDWIAAQEQEEEARQMAWRREQQQREQAAAAASGAGASPSSRGRGGKHPRKYLGRAAAPTRIHHLDDDSFGADLESGSDFDEDLALSEVKARTERRCSRLLKLGGWDDNERTGSSKTKAAIASTAAPKRRRRILVESDEDEDGQSTASSSSRGQGGEAGDFGSSSDSSFLSSSDDENDPILKRLAKLHSHRRRRYVYGRSYQSSLQGGKRNRDRFLSRYPTPSGAFSAQTANGVSDPSSPPRKDAASTESSSSGIELRLESAPTVEDMVKPPSPTFPSGNIRDAPTSSRVGYVDDEDIGEVEMTQGDFDRSVGVDVDGEESIKYEAAAEPDRSLASAGALVDQGQDCQSDDDPLHLDSSFIQPEGQNAALGLPEDTFDRTKSLPYSALPAFFDECIERIENETLPDARIQVEELGRAVRELKIGEECGDFLGKLTSKAIALYSNLRLCLIRDGTDQIRAALRRLADHGEYRRERAAIKRAGSSDQLRLLKKGWRGVELRELGMDKLDNDVELVLRKCQTLMGDLEGDFLPDRSPEINKSRGRKSYDGEDAAIGKEPQAGQEKLSPSSASFDSDAIHYGAFDPHMHAISKREVGQGQGVFSSLEYQRDKAKKSERSRNNPTRSSRDANKDISDFIVSGDGGTKKALRGAVDGRSKAGKKRNSKKRKSYVEGGNACRDTSFFENEGGLSNSFTSTTRRALRGRHPSFAGDNGQHSMRALEATVLDDMGHFDDMRCHSTDQKSALDRMREFLMKNTRDSNDSADFSSAPPEYRPGARAMRGKRAAIPVARRSRPEGDNYDYISLRPQASAEVSEGDITYEGDHDLLICPENLFQDLASASRGQHIYSENVAPAKSILAQVHFLVSKQLLEAYPSSTQLCCKIFEKIEVLTRMQGILLGGSDASKDILQSLLGIIQRDGLVTLMDLLLYGASNEIKVLHLRLLATLVSLLKCGLGSALVPEDGLLHTLFGTSSKCAFIEELLLQIIDVLYSQCCPSAWGDCARGKIPVFVMREVQKLSDSIGKVVPIVEVVSRLLTTQFACQSWYASALSDTNGNFVSSVSPVTFSNYLKFGKRHIIGLSKIRLATLKASIPRSEINALWTIMSFFSKSVSVAPPASQWYRYKHIVRKLFYSDAAVLASDAMSRGHRTGSSGKQEEMCPPGPDHVACCKTDLYRLAVLLSSSALSPLPEQDGILTNLVQKAILLQGDSFQGGKHGKSAVFPQESDIPEDYLVRRIWEVSDIASRPLPVEEFEVKFLQEMHLFNDDAGRLASLQTGMTPNVLDDCLGLTVAWTRQLPIEKKARCVRLRKDMDSLVKHFIEKAGVIEKDVQNSSKSSLSPNQDSAEADFALAFALPDVDHNLTRSDPLLVASFYRESASRLLVTSSVFLSNRMHRRSSLDPAICGSLQKRIWNMLSDVHSRQTQEYILRGRSGETPLRSNNFFLSWVAAKVMAGLAFLHVRAYLSCCEPAKVNEGEDLLSFLVSCIVSSLESICGMLGAANLRERNIFALPTGRDLLSYQPSAALCARASGLICTWLSCIVSRARHTLSLVPTRDKPDDSISQSILNFGSCSMTILAEALCKNLIGITQAKQIGPSADSIFRLNLSLLRNAIGLTQETRKKIELIRRDTQGQAMSSATVSGQKNGGNDVLGGIKDDEFLNIDLDLLVRSQVSAVSGSDTFTSQASDPALLISDFDVKLLDGIAGGELWSFLISIVDISKPSQRYTIEHLHHATKSMDANKLSSSGKTTVARCIGPVCSILAALCSLRRKNSVKFQSLEDAFRGRLSAHHATDHQSRLLDLSYLQHLGQCFSCELCHLSSLFPACDSIARGGLEFILGHYIECLLDTEALHRLPSSNKQIIASKGGPQAQEREANYLKRMLRRAALMEETSFDTEASAVKPLDNESFDSPGPMYMSGRIWAFSKDLGEVLGRAAATSSDEMLTALSKVLIKSDMDLEPSAQLMSEQALEEVPLVSMEREALKKFIKLRGVFSVIFPREATAFGRLAKHIFVTCTKSVIQNLYYLGATVDYLDRRTGDWSVSTSADPVDLYERARAYALQKCYCEFSSALFSWILREGSLFVKHVDTAMQLIKDMILRPSLLISSPSVLSSLKLHGTRPFVLFDDSLSSSKVTFDVGSSHGTSALLNGARQTDAAEWMRKALVRRTFELTVYAAAAFDVTQSSDLLSLLVESALSFTRDTAHEISVALGVILRSTLFTAPARDDFFLQGSAPTTGELERGIDFYLQVINTSTHLVGSQLASLGKLRRFAIRNLLIPKLCFSAIEQIKKERILAILSSLFDHRHCVDKDVLPCIFRSDESIGFINFSDACLVAKGLAFAVREALSSGTNADEMIKNIYFIARCLIELRVNEDTNGEDLGETLLAWSTSRSESEEAIGVGTCREKYFILTFSIWMYEIGRLLADDDKTNLVRKIALSGKSHDKDNLFWTPQALKYVDESNMEMVNMVFDASERFTLAEKELFPIAEKFSKVKNTYARDPTSQGSLPSSAEIGDGMKLSRQCKRHIKEYVAAHLSVGCSHILQPRLN